MAALAALPNVHCKLSGLLTERGDQRPEAVRPYAETILELFGAKPRDLRQRLAGVATGRRLPCLAGFLPRYLAGRGPCGSFWRQRHPFLFPF